MGSRALVLGVAVAVVSLCAPPAWGAFPGRDGDLVVVTGGGLELVVPRTGAAHSLCTSEDLCGHPEQPLERIPLNHKPQHLPASNGKEGVAGSSPTEGSEASRVGGPDGAAAWVAG